MTIYHFPSVPLPGLHFICHAGWIEMVQRGALIEILERIADALERAADDAGELVQ